MFASLIKLVHHDDRPSKQTHSGSERSGWLSTALCSGSFSFAGMRTRNLIDYWHQFRHLCLHSDQPFKLFSPTRQRMETRFFQSNSIKSFSCVCCFFGWVACTCHHLEPWNRSRVSVDVRPPPTSAADFVVPSYSKVVSQNSPPGRWASLLSFPFAFSSAFDTRKAHCVRMGKLLSRYLISRSRFRLAVCYLISASGQPPKKDLSKISQHRPGSHLTFFN